jgi:hypothetical protein
MSNQLENINENQDEKEYEDESNSNGDDPSNSPDSAIAPSDINAWRKRRSIAFQRNPLMFRRMSRGETLHSFLSFTFVLLLRLKSTLKMNVDNC